MQPNSLCRMNLVGIWRRGRGSITAVAAIWLCCLHFRHNNLCLCGLQANPIFGSSATVSIVSLIRLDFRVKRYQWYQSARSISRCISSAVRVCAFACLKSTVNRIALSGQLGPCAPDRSRPHRWIFPPGRSHLPAGFPGTTRSGSATPRLTCDLSPGIVSETSRKL
jgi:hypothetical protein